MTHPALKFRNPNSMMRRMVERRLSQSSPDDALRYLRVHK